MTATAADSMLLAAGEVELRAGDGKTPPRAEILAYSGALMRVPDWGDVVIDLAGIDISAQVVLLADHDASVKGVVGHGRGEVRGGRLYVSGLISGKGDAASQIIELARSGLSFGASVGVSVAEHETIRAGQKVNVNGRTVSSPRAFTLVRKGKLREVSITALAADADTSVAIAASRKEKAMDTDVQNVNEETIRADERERLKLIEATCRPPCGGWGKSQDKVNELKAAAIAGEIEVKDLTAELLTILRDSRPKLHGVYSPGPAVSDVSVLEAALLKRMGLEALGEKTLGGLAMEHGASLRATHTLDLCRAALQLDGQDVPVGRDAMVKAAMST
ncbi:MAG: hypothetical protein KKB50_09400 [Planctomycetes bacterium]|nr:hypothetical protein [Planctomycetota bacterium]